MGILGNSEGNGIISTILRKKIACGALCYYMVSNDWSTYLFKTNRMLLMSKNLIFKFLMPNHLIMIML